MAELVQYLVETVGLPIRMDRKYALPSQPDAGLDRLIELAVRCGAWPSFFALSRYLSATHAAHPALRLERVLRHGYTRPLCVYWTRVFAAEVDDDGALGAPIAFDTQYDDMRLALHHEGERRTAARAHFFAPSGPSAHSAVVQNELVAALLRELALGA